MSYCAAIECLSNREDLEHHRMFKETFKYYKSKCPPPNLESVLDFDEVGESLKEFRTFSNKKKNYKFLGLSDPSEWQVSELPSGLIFIKNPFTYRGQRYWIARCLRDYPKSPHANNLRTNKSVIENWWMKMTSNQSPIEKDRLKTAMRWCTLGYHHDWDTKVYSEDMKHSFPADLGALSAYFADILGLGKYSAEAAIVNFYPIGTTLAGHTDHSEKNLDAPLFSYPLFSYSLGQTAIFLIGGKTKDIKPTAMFLRSGDVVIMSKESRLCYHAVPRVFKADHSPWNLMDDGSCSVADDSNTEKYSVPKKPKINDAHEIQKLNVELWNSVEDELFWQPFNDYLQSSRININVRQVLRDGENSL